MRPADTRALVPHARLRPASQLQEQLTRFMSMNEDLRNKLAVTQAQLRAALEKNGDAETAAPPSRREQERPASTVPAVDAPGPSAVRGWARALRGRGRARPLLPLCAEPSALAPGPGGARRTTAVGERSGGKGLPVPGAVGRG